MKTKSKVLKSFNAKIGKQVGLIVIILAAVLLEAISAFQFYYTRGILERNLEQQVLTQLVVSALRMDGILSSAEASVYNQTWHAQRRLDDPDYMEMIVRNLVKSESDKIMGAFISFKPNYFPSKGYWYEPYARQSEDSVVLEQIGSAKHDYTTKDFYNICIKGDTMKWNSPYLDPDGAQAVVTTFALPVRDKQGQPVAVVGVDVTTEWISEVVNRIRIHPSSFSMVMSPEGQLIAAPEDSLCSEAMANQIAQMINDSTVVKEEKANGRVTAFDYYDKEKGRMAHVYYAQKMVHPKWHMVRVCYDDEAFGELQHMRKNVMWMALAGLLVLGLIIHLFARNGRRLLRSQMKQERIDGELKIAADIQTQMLPRESSIHRSDITLHGSLTPAREVGGDLYDFFIRDEKLLFCIGDVSGKGVPSAMLMAVIHSLFRSTSLHEDNPGHIMQTINCLSCNGNESNMFVTLFIGVLHLPTGQLHYCNAGHDQPILIENGEIRPLPCKANLPIGLFEDMVYNEEQFLLAPSSTLFVYTDGLTEAKRARRDFFGLERVRATLRQWASRCREEDSTRSADGQTSPLQDLISQMTHEVKMFTAGREQSDDLTMLAFSYTPQAAELKV